MNQKRKILSLIIVAIVGSLIYWKKDILMQKFGLKIGKSNNKTEPALPSSSPQHNSNRITYKKCSGFPLKIGCKGSLVRGMQVGLNKFHKAKLQTDGIFGKGTETALMKAGFGKTLEHTEVAKLLNK